MSLSIAFVTSGLPFNGSTLETGSLGGSETALLCMARELAKLGNNVSVFCRCDAPGVYGGVTYLDLGNFEEAALTSTYDVLVVSRFHDYLRFPSFAGMRVLWLHDVLTNPQHLMANLFQTDLVMALSDFHIENYTDGTSESGKLPELKPFIWKTSNGVDFDFVQECRVPEEERDRKRLIYTSRPERGLYFLLKHIFPRLLEFDSEITLAYANYSLKDFPIGDETRGLIEHCDQLADQFGDRVVKLGHLTKKELYREISKSALHLFPSNFSEIFCISCAEAAACGTPVIATNDYAFKETVKNGKTGILVPGQPGTKDYTERFVSACKRLLTKKEQWKKISDYGPTFINERGYRWDKVAESWQKKFTHFLQKRFEDNKDKVVTELVRNHDLMAAQHLGAKWVEPLIFEAGPIPPSNTEDIIQEFMASTPRYTKLMQLLGAQHPELPKTLVDYQCGDAAFGLFYAKTKPDASVVLVDAHPEICERLEAYAERAGLENVKVLCQVSPPPGMEHIHIGENIALAEKPWEFLSEVSEAVKGGTISFISKFGPEDGLAGQTAVHPRLWNLSQADYYEMVSGIELPPGLNFNLTMMQDSISSTGDLRGYWLGCFPASQEYKPITFKYRERRVRPYRSVAACLIAKDEASNVIKCMEALRPIVDTVYVTIDSRTSDLTAELLEPYADRVEVAEFDNFAQMRNQSIKFAKENSKEDWIFWVDFDEVLVEGPKVRRYLNSEIMNGYAIKQAHLMLDVHGTFDTPIRFFKNKEQYRFNGYIHEHSEDVSEQEFDASIKPTVLIPDAELAHYGYPHENHRRNKCSNRNMELLIRDARDNGTRGRMLSWVLVIRDFLNVAKWAMQARQSAATPGSFEHASIEAAISTFIHYFAKTPGSKYYNLAFDMYQEGLSLLAASGIPYQNRKYPPFQVKCAMWSGESDNVEPAKRWYIDTNQYMSDMAVQCARMAANVGMEDQNAVVPLLQAVYVPPSEYDLEDLKLLEMACNAIDPVTGQFKGR